MEIQGLEKAEKRTLDIQWVKEHLVCRLVNRKNNEELLKEIPYRKFYDLAVVYYVPMQQVEDGMLFWTIRKEQAKVLGLEEESLFTLALENTRRRFPIQFSALEQAIRQFTLEAGIDLEEECKCDEEAETDRNRRDVPAVEYISYVWSCCNAVSRCVGRDCRPFSVRFNYPAIQLP